MQILGVTTLIKLQNNTQTTIKRWKAMKTDTYFFFFFFFFFFFGGGGGGGGTYVRCS